MKRRGSHRIRPHHGARVGARNQSVLHDECRVKCRVIPVGSHGDPRVPDRMLCLSNFHELARAHWLQQLDHFRTNQTTYARDRTGNQTSSLRFFYWHGFVAVVVAAFDEVRVQSILERYRAVDHKVLEVTTRHHLP